MAWDDTKSDFISRAGFEPTDTQLYDATYTSSVPAVLNASEVGTGKTVVSTLASLLRPDVDCTIVTVPPILIPQWTAWLNQVAPTAVAYRGTPKQRDTLDLSSVRWVVCSHAIFRDEHAKFHKLGLSRAIELVVDEAHAIKSSGSVLYKCVSRQPKIGLQLLTGTPTSKPLDCYSYIKLRTPQVYRSLGHFESVHVAERDFFGSITQWQNLDLLAERFAVQTIKRTKEAVFGYNLTPIYQTIQYDLSSQHLKLYNQLLEEQLLLLPNGDKIDATTATRLYHAMQQLVCNWHEFSGDSKNRSAIYDLVDSVVEQTDCLNPSKSKLIIWTYYKRTSRNLLEHLGPAAVGAYSEVDSNKSIDKFLNDPNTRILVGQPTSCGVGLNPAHLCSEMLFIESSTVPLHMTQAVGRVDRKGQTVRPTIRFAVANNTIQPSLYGRLINNDDLVSRVERVKSLKDRLQGRI